MLEGVQWILGLVIRGRARGRNDENVGHAVADLGCRCSVPPPQLFRELDVCLFGGICFRTVANERLRHDEESWVDAPLPERRHRLLHVRYGALGRPLPEKQMQAPVDNLTDQRAPIAPHDLNALCVQLPRLLGTCPTYSGVALLVHEQVRHVNLLELHFHRGTEFPAYERRRRLAEFEGLRDRAVGPESDHHGVSVAVDHLGVLFAPLAPAEPALDHGLGVLYHSPPEGCDGRSDRLARQRADGHPREAVNGIGRNLERKLPTIEHGTHLRVSRKLHLLLRCRACCQELLENHWQQSAANTRRDEAMAKTWYLLEACPLAQFACRGHRGAWHQQCAVAQIVPLHDRRVKRREIQRHDRLVIEAGERLQHSATLVGLLGRASTGQWREHVAVFPRFTQQHGKHLDALPPREQPLHRHASHPGHLDVAEEAVLQVEEPQAQRGVIDRKNGEVSRVFAAQFFDGGRPEFQSC
mmetsp:Transcript_70127/g.195051  ORF Transcript_70127/g.195051 Transcript_70127/m.195051 type:complete len:469 (+) Transcript_70127:599-2005(+)